MIILCEQSRMKEFYQAILVGYAEVATVLGRCRKLQELFFNTIRP